MERTTRITLAKENFKFSSGHFTIFSSTERENIHGHMFTVSVVFEAVVGPNGMVFDYTVAKKFMEEMCRSLNEYFLVPGKSPHLTIEEKSDYTYLHFAKEKIPFLKRDIKILPVTNITVEELSHYLVLEFVSEFVTKKNLPIHSAEIEVFSAPGQSASSRWSR